MGQGHSEHKHENEEDILMSNEDPITKVQELIDLGYDEEDATELVNRMQIGQLDPLVYYERLDFTDYEEADAER